MVFFMICDIVLVAIYGYAKACSTARPLALSLLLGIPYLAGMGVGSYFSTARPTDSIAAIAYVIIALAALVSLPVLDPICAERCPLCRCDDMTRHRAAMH